MKTRTITSNHSRFNNNNNPVYDLPLANYNVYWPIIGHLYCMASFFIRHYTLFLFKNFILIMPVSVIEWGYLLRGEGNKNEIGHIPLHYKLNYI